MGGRQKWRPTSSGKSFLKERKCWLIVRSSEMWLDFQNLGGNVCVFAMFLNLSTVTMETACVCAHKPLI